MNNIIKHGKEPFNIITVHGGPGAAGEIRPVAGYLSKKYGVLEPLQTGLSVKSQIGELFQAVVEHGSLPAVLIGHSWGAWLSMLMAARHPAAVKKVILVSSGPFLQDYALSIHAQRMNRLTPGEHTEFEKLSAVITGTAPGNREEAFARFGELHEKTDGFASEGSAAQVSLNSEIFSSVWPEAMKMRESGELLSVCRHVRCHVTAIHGDYDPHPWEGVKAPLENVLNNFRFILLKNCGHTPWFEKEAKHEFYRKLEDELQS